MCVSVISSSVWVAQGSPFGTELLTLLIICSLCILPICYFSNFPFWFEGCFSALIFIYLLLLNFSETVISIYGHI